MTLYNPQLLECRAHATASNVTINAKDNAWHDVDMSAFASPNSLVVLMVYLSEAVGSQGVREKGSAVACLVTASQWWRFTWIVRLNAACIFEGWDGAESASNYQIIAEIKG